MSIDSPSADSSPLDTRFRVPPAVLVVGILECALAAAFVGLAYLTTLDVAPARDLNLPTAYEYRQYAGQKLLEWVCIAIAFGVGSYFVNQSFLRRIAPGRRISGWVNFLLAATIVGASAIAAVETVERHKSESAAERVDGELEPYYRR